MVGIPEEVCTRDRNASRSQNGSVEWIDRLGHRIERRPDSTRQRRRGPGVLDHVRSAISLFVQGQLSLFPTPQFDFVPSARGHHPIDAMTVRSVDEEDRITLPIEIGLEKKRRIDHQSTGIGGAD